MKIITQEEYQKQIAALRTPEEIANFVREYAIGEEVVKKHPGGRPRKFVDLPAPSSNESWRELAGNDLEEKVIALYAKGLTTRDIMGYIKEHHKVEVSQATISNITDIARRIASGYAKNGASSLHLSSQLLRYGW
jgi:hypothetical protein